MGLLLLSVSEIIFLENERAEASLLRSVVLLAVPTRESAEPPPLHY